MKDFKEIVGIICLTLAVIFGTTGIALGLISMFGNHSVAMMVVVLLIIGIILTRK